MSAGIHPGLPPRSSKGTKQRIRHPGMRSRTTSGRGHGSAGGAGASLVVSSTGFRFLLLLLALVRRPAPSAAAYDVASATTLRRSASPVGRRAGCGGVSHGIMDCAPREHVRRSCVGRGHWVPNTRRGHRLRATGPRPGDTDDEGEAGDLLDKGMNLLEIASSRGGMFLPTQPLLVRTAKAAWRFMWERMMSELAPQDSQGNYVRPKYTYSSAIASPDKNSQPGPDEPFVGPYQLYVGNPCPWCHRAVLAVRVLKLDASVPGDDGAGKGGGNVRMTRLIDDPERATRGGWVFSNKDPDPMYRCSDLRELYDRLTPGGSYTGRCTAPLLVDRSRQRIVSNESADIVRFLNRLSQQQQQRTRALADAANHDRNDEIDLYPPHLASEIEATNAWVYEQLNNGVYRCGFATSQAAYDRASNDVRAGLARCDEILSRQPFLVGTQFTEADLRLLPTALRFDGAYAPLFRAGGAHVRVRSYPYVHQWLARCWEEIPGVRDSIDVSDACASYFRQLFPLNPGGIVPSPVEPRELGLP